MLARIAATLGAVALGACTVIGIRSGTEEPAYTLVDRIGAVEIRRYGPRAAAETIAPGTAEAARGEGFRRLAGYIFGANAPGEKLAMTAPVAQSGEKLAMTAPVASAAGPDGWRIRFFMPADRPLAGLPAPRDPSVTLVEIPEATMAVLRFSGSTRAAAVATREAELAAALAAGPWRATGPVEAWFFDPPWTLPPLRRNEVARPVTRD